jgi:hypothetical protein
MLKQNSFAKIRDLFYGEFSFFNIENCSLCKLLSSDSFMAQSARLVNIYFEVEFHFAEKSHFFMSEIVFDVLIMFV